MAIMQCRLSLAGVATILCAASAWGQTQILRVEIPFPFHVGEKHFAAGNYDVRIGEPFRWTVKVVSLSNFEDPACASFFGDKDRDERPSNRRSFSTSSERKSTSCLKFGTRFTRTP